MFKQFIEEFRSLIERKSTEPPTRAEIEKDVAGIKRDKSFPYPDLVKARAGNLGAYKPKRAGRVSLKDIRAAMKKPTFSSNSSTPKTEPTWRPKRSRPSR
jgi:hypothetical protein